MAAEWWSIEVFDASLPASLWRESWQESLVESALTHGAAHWQWHGHSWGVVFEVFFEDEERWEAWRALPAVRAALDAVPDPVNGLLVYRGRGGSAGTPVPRRPRPSPGAMAAEAEPHLVERLLDVTATELTAPGRDVPDDRPGPAPAPNPIPAPGAA
ncbi:hypothetical protein [Actinomadura fibrosa]|uniref:Uncharacterized protein n=1 Tax=Actinomadura fibrosa TaxID=111802 RepID=A0ABW2XZU9_9ACTN|nr:hypothetical protein [Actinomadura fibrosa]